MNHWKIQEKSSSSSNNYNSNRAVALKQHLENLHKLIILILLISSISIKKNKQLNGLNIWINPIELLTIRLLHMTVFTSTLGMFTKEIRPTVKSSKSNPKIDEKQSNDSINNALIGSGKNKPYYSIDMSHFNSAPPWSSEDFSNNYNLSGNHLNQEAFVLLQTILTKNTQMDTLILKDARINDTGAVMIASGLRTNTRLKMLDLSKNLIRCEGALEIAKVIANSINLQWLSLHWNQIRSSGAFEFGNSLGSNTSLLYLDLSWNGFNGKCLENLGKGLTRNCHLKELNLKYNRIDLKSIIPFADCLYTNKSLKKLCLGFNPLTMAGIHELIYVIENSSQCILEELDLEGLTISENILQQVHRINRKRHFVLKVAKCIRWEPRQGKYSKTDPVTFLISYLSRHGMRLLDLYHLLDPQQTGVISEAQFTERMIKNQIPLNPDDLKILINYIDSERTDKITYKLLASRIYFFRISVGEQLRIKATELSKHQLDQHRLFVRPEGPDIIDKPPKGFPSKVKRSVGDSKRSQLSKTSKANVITDPSKSTQNYVNSQEKVYPKANSSDELQKENNDLSINSTEILKTKESKPNWASIITKVSSYYSGEVLDRTKKLDRGSISDKRKPLSIPKYKNFGKPNETTINPKLQVIPITEVFNKKYFQDFPYS
ncbi:LOW QUALITY PROTEIN: nalp (nacht, leucine rich repeat and pyrin domain containing)-related [Schistosoma mansoni]|uniref:nalp (nacht, leucine rich repeat and pyrin domain containing)-related n=1 Tax=Schistosoma mansoni TaxID=6183 RepID=UPI00022DC732|nr:LOW QUALITY PROTEIN: nalp (nacht, leucine rich repeat and pyrin domain containing)-related [Schistosoma mansoni]|eukprot:XP_018648404.1 LOW QUALITY PROTEIN: nalp (nacht, leucine rich repeat and pyrin domain containing)-related [Schistosoma mansoni]